MTSAAQSDTPRWLAYLRLCRAPNVFTAMADVAMGYLVTTQSLDAWWNLVALIAASSLMYTAGMVLNDVFDFDVDLRERPGRPLPSGQISRDWANRLGWGMLVAGLVLAWLTGILSSHRAGPSWRPGGVATVLAACIVLYDGGAKRTIVGPVVMGSCRFLNVLLGMSLNPAARGTSTSVLGFDPSHLMIAAGIGTYIAGVTVFARSEATQSRRGLLVLGVAIMFSGIGLLAFFPKLYPGPRPLRIEPSLQWPVALLVMSIWILRRSVVAIFQPDPNRVQAAVKTCLLSLIVLDATVCLLYCPTYYAVGVLSLLVPTLLLGRWVYST